MSWRLAVVGALVFASAAVAQPTGAPPTTAGLSWFVGRWTGTGTSFGEPGTAQLRVQSAIEGKFVELAYELTAGGSRPFRFEGRAFYKPIDGDKWEARWFDSRGTTFPISAVVSGTTLTSDWGSGDTERGRTTYRLREDRKLEVVDTAFTKDGKEREFARYVYDRAP